MVHIENVARHRLRMNLEKRHVRSFRIEGKTLGASLLRAACLCQRQRHINRFPGTPVAGQQAFGSELLSQHSTCCSPAPCPSSVGSW